MFVSGTTPFMSVQENITHSFEMPDFALLRLAC